MSGQTEQQKMLAGERYNCLDPDLELMRRRAKGLFRRFNLADSPEEREEILRQLLGRIGGGSIIEPPFYCTYGGNTYIGDHVYLNYSCTILDNNAVHIGNHVMVGPGVQLYTAAHLLEAEPRNRGLEVAKPITIEDNVWLGGSAVVLPGVTVGRNAVVGAGAVVTRTVAPSVVVAGNPARVIRRIDQG